MGEGQGEGLKRYKILGSNFSVFFIRWCPTTQHVLVFYLFPFSLCFHFCLSIYLACSCPNDFSETNRIILLPRRKPCSPHCCLQSKVQGSGPSFGKPALTGWLLVMIAPGYFTGCEVHRPDSRILWELAVILPVFPAILSECKCGIAILLQEKCRWSESMLLACSDVLSGFDNESPVRHQLPSLCVGVLRPGHGLRGACGSCFIASSERGGNRWIVASLINAAKVDLGVEMASSVDWWKICPS